MTKRNYFDFTLNPYIMPITSCCLFLWLLESFRFQLYGSQIALPDGAFYWIISVLL